MATKSKKPSPGASFAVGLPLALVPWGLQMIGVAVNLIFGAFILAVAFAAMVYAFWQWERASEWHKALRTGTVIVAALLYFGLVGYQIRSQYLKNHAAKPSVTTALPTVNVAPTSPPVSTASVMAPTAKPLRIAGTIQGTDNTVVGNVPARSITGNGNTIVGATDGHGNTILNRGGTAIGRDARADPTSVAIGAGAHAGNGQPIVQNNSGGINVQQATTGDNSSIINSPVTIGNVPRTISPQEMAELESFFTKSGAKAIVEIHADQFSGSSPLPENFYDALKAGGWTMAGSGAEQVMVLSEKPFQGAEILSHGEPLHQGEAMNVDGSNAIYYLGKALGALNIKVSVNRSKEQPEGKITVTFRGGFAN